MKRCVYCGAPTSCVPIPGVQGGAWPHSPIRLKNKATLCVLAARTRAVQARIKAA